MRNCSIKISIIGLLEKLTLNVQWYDFTPVSFRKLLRLPADCMVKKTPEYIFQTLLHNIARLFMEY